MNLTKTTCLLSILLLFLGLTACGAPPETTGEPASAADTPPPAVSDEAAVTYEPAYPEDVSQEGLTDADTTQQETHGHDDGTEHSHAEGDHSHDDEAEQNHDDGHQH